MSENPRATLRDPRVTRKGWMAHRTEMKPFAKPRAAPIAREMSIASSVGTPLPSRSAHTTADRDTIEPTDKSMPPERSTIVMPKAMMLTVAVWLAILMKLPKVKNDRESREKMMTRNTNAITMPNWETNLPARFLQGRCFSSAMVRSAVGVFCIRVLVSQQT